MGKLLFTSRTFIINAYVINKTFALCQFGFTLTLKSLFTDRSITVQKKFTLILLYPFQTRECIILSTE